MTSDPSDVTIRSATAEDIPAIKAVLATTWRDTYASILTEAAISHVTSQWHAPERLALEIVSPATYTGVAVSSTDGVVGMVTAHIEGGVITVSRLYVLPGCQRKGLGARLLSASIEALPCANSVTLEVEEENAKGRAFYRKQGFEECGAHLDDVFGVPLSSVSSVKVLRHAT